MIQIDDKITITIDGYGSFGEGVAHYQDYTVFVPMVVVSECVTVQVTFVKKNIVYAQVVDIVERSQHRVVAPCKHFGVCGGCQLQHIEYDQQRLIKQQLVANNLRKIGGVDCQVLPTVASPLQYQYRNKISLPFGGKTGAVKLGMYKQNTHYIVDIDSCSLAGEWADKLVEIVRRFVNENALPPYNERRHTGLFRHLVARYIDGQLLVTLVANGEIRANLRPLFERLSQSFNKVGLFVNINTAHNNVIMSDNTQHIFGIKHIVSTNNNVKYNVQTDSFFQVNDGAKDLLYAKAKELLYSGDAEVFIDCFSGVGLLTAYMYNDNCQCYSIEIVPQAVEDALALKQQNGLHNLQPICGDVAVELPKLIDKYRNKSCAMIVDPPRKGLGDTVCDIITNNAPDRLVYISCDSSTLARDLSKLTAVYNIAYCQPFDLFPNTRHVETLVLLVRK